MAVNKVVFGGNTIIDLTDSTVDASHLLSGYTAYDRAGVKITGTATTGGAEAGYVWQDASGYVHLSDESGDHIYVEPLSVTANGTYSASSGHAYSPVVVDVAGGGFTADDIAMRTISGTISGSATTISSHAFASCSALTSVNFPSCTSIGNIAFAYCSALKSVSFPLCVSIGMTAFQYCSALIEVSFPSCTSISAYAFAYCSALKSVSFPLCVSIGMTAFASCSALTSVNFPSCTTISNIAFAYCSALKSVSFPLCVSIGSSTFQSCTALTEVNFPLCVNIGNYAFRSCSVLTSVSFPLCVSIGSYAFYYCSALTAVSLSNLSTTQGLIHTCAFQNCYHLLSLYLLASTLYRLSISSTTFVSTPIGGYTTSTGGVYGSIFVPASLYDAYISSTNWSYFSERFVSLTDTEIQNVLDYGTHNPT